MKKLFFTAAAILFLNAGQSQIPYFMGKLPDYIIITNNKDVDGKTIPLHQGKSMTQIFQDLADWKTQKGVPAVVVTVDEIKAKYQEKLYLCKIEINRV